MSFLVGFVWYLLHISIEVFCEAQNEQQYMFLRGMTPLIPVFFIHVTSKFVPCEKQNKTKRPDLLSKTLNLFKNNHVNCVFFVSSIGRLYCRYCYANEVAIVPEIIGGGQKSSEGMTS